MTDGESSQVPGPSPSGESAVQREQAAGNGAKAPEDMTVGELVFEVSDRASGLIREEIELAKTEVTEKVNRLLRGSVAGLAAGIFVVLALFLLEAAIFLLIGAGAGLFAWRSFKRAAPPTPDMAIEQAKEIKAAFEEEERV
jgi:hypothetical protein